ncbi:peptidylprolyl isomerase [Candidatus Proelusimicrobium excrementi]|uniref:peptidylprolyl isomerase n=1 Tax=Candidatus Proelusimicrobium excrementi TaxID=3416222 RepID=UPI003CA35848|nr:SurA N-terminal domain-containing protein [Elusimicrobiaceae bacterium]
MKLNKITAITLAAFLGAAALNAKVVDSTVATVNGKPILNSEYEKVSQATLENYKNREPAVLANKDNVTAIKEEVLNQMIIEQLLLQAAKEQNIKVKDSEVNESIVEIKKRFQKDASGKDLTEKEAQKAFNDELKKEGLTYKQFENRIKDQLAVKKMIDSVAREKAKAPTKEQTQQLYDDIRVLMKGEQAAIKKLSRERLELAAPLAAKLTQITAEQIKLSPVFVKVDKNATQANWKLKEKEAKDIKKKIASGKITFTEAIEKFSDDKTPLAAGGEMILIRGLMPKDFDDKVFNVKVGEISDPIKTEDGYYVIRVNEKKAQKDFTYKEIEPELARFLAAAEMQKANIEFLNSLKDKAEIKVMVKFEYSQPAPEAKTEAKPAAKK